MVAICYMIHQKEVVEMAKSSRVMVGAGIPDHLMEGVVMMEEAAMTLVVEVMKRMLAAVVARMTRSNNWTVVMVVAGILKGNLKPFVDLLLQQK